MKDKFSSKDDWYWPESLAAVSVQTSKVSEEYVECYLRSDGKPGICRRNLSSSLEMTVDSSAPFFVLGLAGLVYVPESQHVVPGSRAQGSLKNKAALGIVIFPGEVCDQGKEV